MTEALKPCPFCKTAPRHLEAKEGFWPERVICDVCHFHLDEENVLSAVSRWNHLATPAPAQPDPLHVANERGEGEPVAWLRSDGSDACTADRKLRAMTTQGAGGARIAELFNRPLYLHPLRAWQPIETAPKDGTAVLCLSKIYTKPFHYECNWNGLEWYHGFGEAWDRLLVPTHWMPLPAAPKEKP